MRRASTILLALLQALTPLPLAAQSVRPGGADARDRAAPVSRPAGVTLAAQKRLADRLNAIKGPSLAASLSHNRADWEGLSPDQRDRFRQEALSFLSQSPERQEQLLARYQKLIALSADRQEHYRQIAKWLQVVVDSMTPAQREALLKMAPEQRAKELLARKAVLVSQGKLPEDPASRPAEGSHAEGK